MLTLNSESVFFENSFLLLHYILNSTIIVIFFKSKLSSNSQLNVSAVNCTVNIQLFVKSTSVFCFFNILGQFVQGQTMFAPNQMGSHTHTGTTNLRRKYQC